MKQEVSNVGKFSAFQDQIICYIVVFIIFTRHNITRHKYRRRKFAAIDLIAQKI